MIESVNAVIDRVSLSARHSPDPNENLGYR